MSANPEVETIQITKDNLDKLKFTSEGLIEIENATGRIINNKMAQDMVEKVKMTTQNQMLRPMSGPEPIITHKVTTLQMTKIAEGKPAQPADANEKTGKGV